MEANIIQAPDFSKLLTKVHDGKWVAISSDYQRLVATADTLAELEREVGGADVTVMRVLPSDVGFAPMS